MKIQVSKAAKAGVGKYESVEVQASFEIDLPPGTKAADVREWFAKAWETVDAEVNLQLQGVQGVLKDDSVFKMEEPVKQRRKK